MPRHIQHRREHDLRLYLDTADRSEAEELLATGLFCGITTNPTILRRAGLDVGDVGAVHDWASAAGAEEIFLQAWGPDVQTLVERGHALRDLGDDVVVKFPASRIGAQACATATAHGVPTLLTAVYSTEQVLVAAAAGARYVAPYLGKMIEVGRAGMADIEVMQRVLTGVGSPTRILLASVRETASLVEAAAFGVSCATLAPAVARTLFSDHDTADAVQVFEDAAVLDTD